MNNIPTGTPTIVVNVDISKDQITDNTADSLQITLTYTIDPQTVVIDGQSYITSTKVVTSTLGYIKAQSDSLSAQIAALTAQKAIVDALIQPVTDAVTTAIANIQ